MSTYTPDAWTIIRFTTNGEAIDKVLSGWYGGYLGADAWKISSGITKIEETDEAYLVHNHSGSVYTCYKGVERMSGLMYSMYDSWAKQLTESTLQTQMETVEITAILEKYK
jgi:hypothetical protein